MMKYAQLQNRPKSLLSLTGLTMDALRQPLPASCQIHDQDLDRCDVQPSTPLQHRPSCAATLTTSEDRQAGSSSFSTSRSTCFRTTYRPCSSIPDRGSNWAPQGSQGAI
jgi:hypothetical protein